MNIKEMSHRMQEVWNSGQTEMLDELCAGDYVCHDPVLGEVDLDRFKHSVREYRRAFPDLRMGILQSMSDGNFVTTRWRSTGHHQGTFMGAPASGKEIVLEGITVTRISGGKIAEDWSQFNLLGLLQQLGIVPHDFGPLPETPEGRATA